MIRPTPVHNLTLDERLKRAKQQAKEIELLIKKIEQDIENLKVENAGIQKGK